MSQLEEKEDNNNKENDAAEFVAMYIFMPHGHIMKGENDCGEEICRSHGSLYSSSSGKWGVGNTEKSR